ncbi:MAG TPA: LptF/LptG family permease [Aestuariivirgaceae bacterium]|nr:LptF/LptG family permease [Aestuariivirgaceae bacterium]
MTLAWMFTRMALMRFSLILFGITAFVLSLEVVTYVDEIVKLHDNALFSMAYYALLRLPMTLSTFMPISVLLALLLTLTELSYRSELIAIWAAGGSPLQVMVMLLPLGIVLGGLNFVVNDQATPRAAPVLHEWAIGDYGKKQLDLGEKDPIWMRSGNDIVRAGDASAQASELDDVIIFRRDEQGRLIEQIMARRAVLDMGRWQLFDVVVYYPDNLPPNRLERLVYGGAMRPAASGVRSGDPEEMSMADLSYFIANSGFGIRPVHVYQTWWHKRTTLLFSAWLMVAICVPLALRFRRGGGIGYLFAVGVAIGFVFFVLDGISITLGEIGLMPPALAAWLPMLILAAVAAALTVRAEAIG